MMEMATEWRAETCGGCLLKRSRESAREREYRTGRRAAAGASNLTRDHGRNIPGRKPGSSLP